ncbi:unnamed protein product [Symbiodinium sp. KB8]|nr:unnamed protein product [Symbiodinium sp. KB8]
MLQAQLIPEAMQDGRMDEPYTTYVMQLEGTLLRKEHDRRAGFKHMIRPHAENTLRLLSKASKGKGHVWFWGSEQQAMVSQLTESLFLGSEVRPASALGPASRLMAPATERGVGMSVFQGLAPAFLGKEHRFKDFAGEEAAMERRREKGDTDQAPAGVDITQRLARDHFLVKRVEPLPRYTPSVVLVDHELRNYELNPDNTILVPEFVEYKEDDDALLTVVAFAHLFHSLYKRKEVRTASDALRWVRKRHPDISINPYAMGRHIREESSAITRELDLMERSSLSAVAKQVSKHTIFGSGRAITPSSTRLGAEHMPEGSLVARQVAAMKKRNAAWQAAQIKAAKKAAGEE